MDIQAEHRQNYRKKRRVGCLCFVASVGRQPLTSLGLFSGSGLAETKGHAAEALCISAFTEGDALCASFGAGGFAGLARQANGGIASNCFAIGVFLDGAQAEHGAEVQVAHFVGGASEVNSTFARVSINLAVAVVVEGELFTEGDAETLVGAVAKDAVQAEALCTVGEFGICTGIAESVASDVVANEVRTNAAAVEVVVVEVADGGGAHTESFGASRTSAELQAAVTSSEVALAASATFIAHCFVTSDSGVGSSRITLHVEEGHLRISAEFASGALSVVSASILAGSNIDGDVFTDDSKVGDVAAQVVTAGTRDRKSHV